MRGEGGLDRIVYQRFFADRRDGVFVDVGAAGPDFLSMSALYRELGWRVIAIEPNPVFCAAHRARGHEVLEYACSDRDADDSRSSIRTAPLTRAAAFPTSRSRRLRSSPPTAN